MGYPLDPGETLNMMVRRTDEHSKEKGFQHDWDLARKLEQIANEIIPSALVDFDGYNVADAVREAAQALRKHFIGMKIALMHSELSEALERLRDVGVEAIVNGDDDFLVELGDVEIRAWELVAILAGDDHYGQLVEDKMKKNRERPYMHGRQAG